MATFNSFNPFLSQIAKQCVENTEKNEKIFLKKLSHTNPARSTGSVLMDYMLRGGLHSKFITFAGLPHSGKSLTANSIVVDACRDGIPVFYYDTEGNISIQDLEELFGDSLDDLMKNNIFNFYQSKSGRIIENVFNSIEEALQFFPSKEYVDEKESWYYTFIHDARTEEGKKDQQMMKEMLNANKDLKIDKELSNSELYGRGIRDYVKIPDSKNKSGIQGVFIIDSLANMIPEKRKDDATEGGMLQEPKLFSTYLKRVCPDLTNKCIMLVATNQGYMEMPTGYCSVPKYIEKGGVGITHQRAIGYVLVERSASTAGGEKEEANPTGTCNDLYTYTEFKCTRNRLFKKMEKQKIYRRSWQTTNGDLFGWDPFWDVYKYLELTKQIEKNRGKINLKLGSPLDVITWSYEEFKAYVLSFFIPRQEYRDLKDKILKEVTEGTDIDFEDVKDIDFKALLFAQISNGDIFKDNEETSEENSENEGEGLGGFEDEINKVEEL